MAQPYLSIIIPAYNEAKRIPLTLIDIDKRLATADFSYEIVVVNDGSKDNTAEVVHKMSAMIRNLHLVDNVVNRGKGAVVRQGMLLGKGAIRLFMDADNATTIDHFIQMIPFFSAPARGWSASGGKGGAPAGGQGSTSGRKETKYDVVICDRGIKGSELDPPEPWYRQVAGKLGNLWIQIFLLPGIWDTQCGFKAFTAEAAERVFLQSEINGWGFDAEILALAKALNFRIKEVPVHWVAQGKGKVTPSAYLHVLWETVKIRWWLLIGHYRLGEKEISPVRNDG